MIRRIAIFGATGDLALRYLLPALARLHERGKLQEGFAIVGVGRDEMDTGSFRSLVEESPAEPAADVPENGALRGDRHD